MITFHVIKNPCILSIWHRWTSAGIMHRSTHEGREKTSLFFPDSCLSSFVFLPNSSHLSYQGDCPNSNLWHLSTTRLLWDLQVCMSSATVIPLRVARLMIENKWFSNITSLLPVSAFLFFFWRTFSKLWNERRYNGGRKGNPGLASMPSCSRMCSICF